MSEAFDPYRKWLGIPPKDQPPNHYRLLGIATFESDPDVIENAATRQMAHVRTFKTGRHAALSQKILNELSAAKLCLLTPDRKAPYDTQLRSQLAAAGKLSDSMILPGPPELPLPPAPVPPAAEPPTVEPPAAFLPRIDDRWRMDDDAEPEIASPPPVPIPMPVGTAVAPVGVAVAPVGVAVSPVPMIRGSSAAALRARRNSSSVPLALSIICLIFLAGAAAVAALVFGGMVDFDSMRQPGSNAAGKNGAPPVRVEKPAEEPPAKPSRKSKATDFPVGASGAKASTPAEQAGDDPPSDEP
jgi:hypothetical protein